MCHVCVYIIQGYWMTSGGQGINFEMAHLYWNSEGAFLGKNNHLGVQSPDFGFRAFCVVVNVDVGRALC